MEHQIPNRKATGTDGKSNSDDISSRMSEPAADGCTSPPRCRFAWPRTRKKARPEGFEPPTFRSEV